MIGVTGHAADDVIRTDLDNELEGECVSQSILSCSDLDVQMPNGLQEMKFWLPSAPNIPG